MERRKASFVIPLGVLSISTLALLAADRPSRPTITGDYIEARDCDVWTGPCFANGEINVTGTHGIIGWQVREGSWRGTRLDGLALVAVLDAEGTLTTRNEGRVRSVVFVDERASALQEKTLLAMASELAPRYFQNVLKVERGPITFERQELRATLEAGRRVQAKVTTIALDPIRDRHCGNEQQGYPPLCDDARVECAKTVDHFYRGRHLDETWRQPGTRGAMVGTFELEEKPEALVKG